ncbi:MAG: hypothetical protein AAGD33_10615 [Actinomycetota bacterium]
MDRLEVVEVAVSGGGAVLVPVVSVDGSELEQDDEDPAAQTGIARLDVQDLLDPVEQFGSAVREKLAQLRPSCGVGAAISSGKVVALVVDGGVDVSMKLKLEWDLSSDGSEE